MSEIYISGIQQIGIGVKDAREAFIWYNKTLGLDVPVFDDEAQAKLMVHLSGNVVRTRRAILAVNMAGGGGAEIWESRNPKPLAPTFEPKLGDLGIFCNKIKAQNVAQKAKELGLELYKNPAGKELAYLQDPYGNPIQLCEDSTWFSPKLSNSGGVLGAIIGVSNMDKSIQLYRDTLGMNICVYDETGAFTDFKAFGAENETFRRVLLRKEYSPDGAFSALFGAIEIELVQKINAVGRTIFEGRSWGDLGYVHLCFDTLDMDGLGKKLKSAGYDFVVDSANSFDMGDAAGRFTYIIDPDGALIEFVETHKVPIMKKWGWFINLKKRGTRKPLPNWMIKTLGWGREKL
jgi:catechol 2,3-dioxygenase-like lactoylglutathione lyase family enzyme